jgi:hypothetical protein
MSRRIAIARHGAGARLRLAPRCLDWCAAVEADQTQVRLLVPRHGRRARWTPESDDLLGWATLLMTAPAILIGGLLALAWLGG